MGNWNISIRGVGPHHNRIKEDAEQIAHKFVEELKKAGHNIASASITYGGENLLVQSQDFSPVGVSDLKEEYK